MKPLNQLYHALPPPVKNLAATLHGYGLRRWRYGPETERLVAEALERERWPAERLRAWQQERLARLLHLAVTRVPHYRDLWAERRRHGDRRSWEELENWPVLRRETLRVHSERFLVEGPRPPLRVAESSGTSGTPSRFWRSRWTDVRWYALVEARWRRWYGLSRDDRWAILGGQKVVPPERTKPPFGVWNGALRQLYLSAYHHAPENVPHYLEALRRYRVRYLYGYGSSLSFLANGILEQQLEPPPLAIAISNAEQLFPGQREAIEQAFRCPVRDTYGMAELAAAASECEHGRLHLWPEAGLVELFSMDEEHPMPAGETGRLVCTGLLNEEMPLIRYEVGDCGTLAAPGDDCPCGRTLPVLASIDGRVNDALRTPDGRRIYRLTGVFLGNLRIREAQVIQDALDRVCVRCVPAAGFSEEDERTIISRLEERLTGVRVQVETVPSIARGPRGKFPYIISRIPETAAPPGD